MEHEIERYTGCLLGLAAGDAAGFAGSVKMPLLNGFTPTTSHTQLAAYSCNGLLLGLTRGQLSGTMAPPVRYIAQALGEWALEQTFQPSPKSCWLSRTEGFGYRRCQEPEILDMLPMQTGTLEEPVGSLDGPGALMSAAAVGLFFDPERLSRREIQRLGAEAAALTHGDAGAQLAGAALSHILSRLVWGERLDIAALSKEAGAMARRRFRRSHAQAVQLSRCLYDARHLARTPGITRREALARLVCRTAPQVLAGAVYCCLISGSFETALEAAVDHDGDRTAVAAITGALYGAMTGDGSIDPQRLALLECESALRELARDMFQGCPMMQGSNVFDMEWDEKYGGSIL